MADGGLRTDLLDDFGKKLDQIYVKLEQMDKQLQKFENREVSITLSKDSRATARALDELARAFYRFNEASNIEVEGAGRKIITFLGQLQAAMGSFKISGEFQAGIKFAENLSKLVKLFKDLQIEDLSDINSRIAGFVISLNLLTKVQLDAAMPALLADFIRQFVRIIKTFAGVDDDIASSSKSIKTLATTVKDVFSILNKVQIPQVKPDDIVNINLFIRRVDSILSFMARSVVPANRKQLEKFANTVVDFFGFVKNLKIPVIQPGQLDQYLVFFRGLVTLFGRIEKADLASKKKHVEVFGKLLGIFSDIFKKFKPPKIDESLFNSIKGIIRLVRSIADLDLSGFIEQGRFFTKAGPSIKALQQVFKLIGDAVKTIVKTTKGADVNAIRAIGTIVRAMADATAAAIVLADLVLSKGEKQVLKALDVFVAITEKIRKAVEGIIKLSGSASIDGIQAVGQIIAALADMLPLVLRIQDRIEKLGNKAFDNSLKQFGKIFKTIEGFLKTTFKSLSNIPPDTIKGAAGLFEALGVTIKAVVELLEVSRKIKVSEAIQFFTTFNVMFFALRIWIGTIISVTKSASVAQIDAAGKLFVGVGATVNSLARMVETLQKITLGQAVVNAIKLTLLLRTVRGFLSEFIKIVADVSVERIRALATTLNAVGALFTSIARLVKELQTISFGDAIANAFKLRAFFAIIKPILKEIVELTKGAQPGVFSEVGQLFDGLSKVIVETGKVISLSDNSIISFNLRKLTFLFGVFGFLKSLVKTIVKLGNEAEPEKVRAVAEILQAIGQIITIASSALEKIPGTTIGKELTEVFKSITKTLEIVQKAAKGISEQSIRNLTEGFRLLRDALELFDQIESKRKNDSTGNLDRFVKELQDVIDKLKKIKIPFGFKGQIETLVKTLEFVNKADVKVGSINGLKDLFKVLSDFKRPEGLEQTGKDLQDFLKAIDKLDENKIKALEGVFKGGSGTDQLKESLQDTSRETKILGGNFSDLSDEISEGIVEGTAKINLLRNVTAGLRFVAEQAYSIYQQFGTTTLFRNAIEGAAALGDAIKEIGDNVRDAGENIRDMGSTLSENFGVGALIGSDAFGSAVDFDRVSTQLEVFGGLNEEALAQAQAFANQIGIDYPLSANDALAATLDLVKAGQSLSDVEFILPAAADLAALSDSGDLNLTTNALIAAANGFKVFSDASGTALGGFENIDLAANIISGAADISTASVESLSEGLANVGPAANAFGLSLEETAAILAIFDQNAISGAEGGTALRSLLNALGSDASIANLQALGVSLFDPETGNRRPLNDIINDIGASLNDLPEAERASVLQSLADTYGRQGLNILLNAGADAIDNTVAAINGVAPASDRAAAMLDNFAGDVEQLKGSMETLLVRVLLPTLERFFRPFVQIARFVIDGFLGLSDSVLTFVGSMISLVSIGATVIGGLLVMAGVVLQVGGAVFIVIGTLINFGAVIAGIAIGITAFVTGLAAILLTVTAVLPIILGVTAIFETLFSIFKSDAGGAATAARNFFGAIAGVGSSVISFFSSLFNLINANSRFFSRDGGGFATFGASIASFFNGLTESLNSGVIGQIRDNLNQVSQIFNTFAQVRNLIDRRRSNNETDVGGLRGMSESIAASNELIDREIDNLLNNLFFQNALVRNAIENLFGASGFDAFENADDFFEVFTEFSVNIAQRFDEVVQVFQNFVGDILDGVSFGDAFTTLATDFDAAAGEFVRSIIDFLAVLFGPARFVQQLQLIFRGGLSDGLGRLIPLIVDSIRESVIANRDTLRGIVTTLFSFFFAPLKSLRFFADLLGIEPIVRLVDFFQGIVQKLVGGLFDTVINVLEGQSIGEALTNAFGEGIGPLVRLGEAIFNAVGLIADAIGLLFGSFNVEGSDPIGGFIDFISNRVDSLANTINTISELILEPLSRGDFGAVFSNIGGLIVEKLSQVGQFIKDSISAIDIDFAGIGTAILNNLISGITTAFTNLTELTGIDFSNVINLLTTTLESNVALLGTGPEGVFAGVSNTIVGLLISAVVGAFDTITGLTGIDFSSVATNLTSLLDTTLDANLAAAQAGGVGGIFSVAANTIVGLLGAAISTALLSLGDFLELDTTSIQATLETSIGGVFDSIQGLFQDTEEGDSIFTNIKQTIDNIVLAFTTLFDFFSNNAAPDTSGAGGALQVLLDFIGGLVGFGLDTITSLFNAVDTFFEELSNLDAAQLTTLAVAITAGAVAFFIFSGGLTAMATSAVAFSAAALPVIGAIAGFVAIVLILKAVADNIGEIFDVLDLALKGDILGAAQELFDALLNIFADIAFTIAGFLGFDTIFGSTQDEIVANARTIGNQIITIFDILGQRLADFISIGIANLQLLGSHAKAAAAGVFGSADENFEAVNQFFQETQDFSLQALGQIKNAEVDAGVVANFALVNQDQISQQVRDEISANIAAGVNGISADQVQTLIDVGALDRVLQDAIRSGDTDIVSAIFASGNTNIAPEQIQASIDQILESIENGLIGREEGLDLLALLGFDTTTLEPVTVDVPIDVNAVGTEGEPVLNEAQQEIERLRAEAQTASDAAAASAPPVTTEIATTTEVVPAQTPEELVAEVQAEAQAQTDAIQASVAEQQQAIETELGVTTETTTLGLENIAPETLPQLSVDIAALQTNLGLLKTDIDATIPVLQTVVAEFTLFNDSLVLVDTQLLITTPNITLLTTAITQLGLAAAFHLQLVLIPALQGIIDKGVVLGLAFPLYIGLASTAMQTFATTAQGAFGAIASGTAAAISNVQKLTKALTDADAAARSVDSAINQSTGGDSGPDTTGVPGNAGGGSFKEGDIRQVDEGGSEVLIENGKMYLLARRPGKVKTLEQSGFPDISNARRSGVIPPASNNTTSVSNNSNVQVRVEGTQLSLTVNGSNLTSEQLAREVIPRVQQVLRERDRNIKSVLRTNGR